MDLTTKHIISLQNHRGTSYKMYIAVQNELNAAINELRDVYSIQKFGVTYASLSNAKEDKKDAIETIIPRRISEAEPYKIGDD